MATEPVRRKCASSPTPDGKEGWQGIALEREQIGETDEEFRADVEFMEARAEKVLEELRRLLGQFRHRSYSGLRGQEFLMIYSAAETNSSDDRTDVSVSERRSKKRKCDTTTSFGAVRKAGWRPDGTGDLTERQIR